MNTAAIVVLVMLGLLLVVRVADRAWDRLADSRFGPLVPLVILASVVLWGGIPESRKRFWGWLLALVTTAVALFYVRMWWVDRPLRVLEREVLARKHASDQGRGRSTVSSSPTGAGDYGSNRDQVSLFIDVVARLSAEELQSLARELDRRRSAWPGALRRIRQAGRETERAAASVAAGHAMKEAIETRGTGLETEYQRDLLWVSAMNAAEALVVSDKVSGRSVDAYYRPFETISRRLASHRLPRV